ncbi:ATP-binding cassette domain-containing protein [Enterovirga rhinocerotis]|uniref:ABC-type transport system involved in cytochrome bd biosynthesis fused ATPase/permease subunit n=1 Tax=Enterovirga rhinocerotis TaxID=1339210 RepID=A0A4R7BVZ4_9HYPH|nr:ATP-binding cassette domain-containing protein [Enterovirga rhinocerotis]TDR90024.1 ABC-type transport system involved in cytochrome bd biosynthesis fused ATPase/permease subunit [Enterovirga rhinocerotis]
MTTLSAPPTEETSETGRPPKDSPWAAAILLALAALACGVLLAGLSAWFLGAVAIAGLSSAALTFNVHIPAALVRLFAIGRTAAKYGERLVGHKAALLDQARRRGNLFAAMARAPSVRRAGWQFGDQDRLADYLDDVEDMDFAKLRVDLPLLTVGAGALACLVATLLVAPLAILPIAALAAAIAALAARLAVAGQSTWDEVRRARREGSQRIGAAIAAALALQAEDAWSERLSSAFGPLARAEDRLLAMRRSFAALDAVAGLFGPLAGMAVMAAAWFAGERLDGLLVPAFLAFAWLALGETALGASKILVAALRRRAAAREIARWSGDATAEPRPEIASPRLTTLRLAGWQRLTPNHRPIGRPFAATFEAGRPTLLTGPSGCGKTSLLKQIAGWIGNDIADSRALVLLPGARRQLSVFCPHDAAILADTVRANLFAPKATDDAIRQALAAMELGARIDEAGGLDGWITQESLSLGERQRLNLARAWLSTRPLVLLDEPTEHLDPDQGARILDRLFEHLRDRIVILSSHRGTEEAGDRAIRL